MIFSSSDNPTALFCSAAFLHFIAGDWHVIKNESIKISKKGVDRESVF